MKRTLPLGATLFAVMVLTAGGRPAYAADDDVPSFNNRGDDEKAFVAKVGTAIVKAARTSPIKVELDTYKFEDPKKGRKDLKINMTWQGAITKKKFISNVVVRIDVTDEKKWEVLNVDYKDDSVSISKYRAAEVQALIKRFNR
jgi:hypothetical protein